MYIGIVHGLFLYQDTLFQLSGHPKSNFTASVTHSHSSFKKKTLPKISEFHVYVLAHTRK